MSDEDEATVKKQYDLDATIAASKSKLITKEEPQQDDDDEDDVPLAFSRARKRKAAASAAKVKKEELNSEEEELKPKNTQKAKSNVKASTVKKEKPEDSEESEEEMKKKKTDKKKEETKKVVKKFKEEVDCKMVKVKKGKKVYDLPGQKHDPPEERDPLRIFYESLFEQVPTSEMAAFWMMEWGLLPPGVAKKVHEKKQNRSQHPKLRSPTKVVSVKRTSDISVKTVKKKTTIQTIVKTTSKKQKGRDLESDEDDDDFVLSNIKNKKRKASA